MVNVCSAKYNLERIYVCYKKGKSNLFSIIFGTFYYFLNNFNKPKTESPEKFQKWFGVRKKSGFSIKALNFAIIAACDP